MNQLELLRDIVKTYQKYGWQLRRALFTPATQEAARDDATLGGAVISEHEIDALWFARPSAGGREAWELRHLNAAPYALFETFEPDENEEDREEARLDTEARLREYARQRAANS